MKEDKTPSKTSSGKENEPVVENGKKKVKEEKPATKVVVRRLPPTMTEEQFKLQVSPLPDFDYFYYMPADMSLTPNAFSRAYINFVDQSDLFIFTQKFDGYVFLDSKGGEFTAVVEFAPFQRIPKNRPNRRKDPRTGTIENDPVFTAFKERMEAESLENKATANASKQHFFETSLAPEKKEVNNTPLLEFIKNRKADRQRIREEKREEKRKKDSERRRVKEEQRRIKKEDDISVVKVLNTQNSSRDRLKEKELKQGFVKKKSDEVKSTIKEKSSIDSRPKENKTRTGKSYLEERQRQAERREEQKKKLSQSHNSTDAKSTPDDTVTVNEDKPAEDKPTVTENKGKETEHKKSEKVFKREEVKRSSYNKYDKYESKRDRESDETRRTRRTNDRSHQNSRREEERSEEGGRKRYSESRRSHDSAHRDRYKDKDKNKTYSQKKISTIESDKTKNITEDPNKSTISCDLLDESPPNVGSESKEDTTELIGGEQNKAVLERDETKEVTVKQKIFESKDNTKPTRRKSLEYERNRSLSTYSTSKSYNKEKYSEIKRRNSVGSSKQHSENSELNNQQDENDYKHSSDLNEKLHAKLKPAAEFKITDLDIENKHDKEDNIMKECDEIELPKRRNSTGERKSLEKVSPRRNSLGSEDKNKIFTFQKDLDSGVVSEEAKPKDEKKNQRSSHDPRPGRRIRNKDRPSIEIYRPGMGKFSKQRLEREKGLGSSTEVESPSSSPSPTPVLKHKSVALH